MPRRRVELDIGCGLGQFALMAALERPDTLIVGIEINEHLFSDAEKARHRREIDNVRFIHAEAESWIRDYVPRETIDAFHFYFPTPYVGALRKNNVLATGLTHWLFSHEFLLDLQRAAVPGAILRVVTDSERYFEHVREVTATAGIVEVEWTSPIQQKAFNQVVGTRCEGLMRRLERSILKAQYLFL